MNQLTESELEKMWVTDPRWKGITRPYTAKDVVRLRGTITIEHTLAELGSRKLWTLLHAEKYVPTLGALTGHQALQQVSAGLRAIYLSGWQVAADGNLARQMYPDQSLYPCNSIPELVRAINNAFIRVDQIACSEGKNDIDWFAPIVADGEAGFGGFLNTFELMKAMIEAGAAGVHFEDQADFAKKSDRVGGKILIPAQQFVQKLIAARMAADICGVPMVLIGRTDANSAGRLVADSDLRDLEFLTGERIYDGNLGYNGGINAAIKRALIYAPYVDVICCDTSDPDIQNAKRFAEGVRRKFPDKLLAYNYSTSFHWRQEMDTLALAKFQHELGELGYKFQCVTLAGFHTLNVGMFLLAKDYLKHGIAAYPPLQEEEFRLAESAGYSGNRHQRFVGTEYFRDVEEIAKSSAERFRPNASRHILKKAASGDAA